jgi:hypothetical protein
VSVQLRRCSLAVAVVAIALAARAGGASAQEVPEPVQLGLRMLSSGGYEAVVNLWTTTWSDSGDSEKRLQLRDAFSRLVELAGPPLGYETICAVAVSSRLRRVYVLLLHRQQPAYMRLTLYRPEDSWLVTNIAFDTEASRVLPPSLLDPTGSRACL